MTARQRGAKKSIDADIRARLDALVSFAHATYVDAAVGASRVRRLRPAR